MLALHVVLSRGLLAGAEDGGDGTEAAHARRRATQSAVQSRSQTPTQAPVGAGCGDHGVAPADEVQVEEPVGGAQWSAGRATARTRSSPLADLDAVIHAPKRLAAMALLDATTGADLAFLRDHLQRSDSDLSKQMSALQAAGYVDVSKFGRGRGGTTTYTVTRAGSAAYRRHRQALEALLHAGR